MWSILILNSLAFAGLLFLLASGYSLVFGLMRIPNMAHGVLFLAGGYIGASLVRAGLPFWGAVILAGVAVAIIGGCLERLVLRRMAGREAAEVLATIGVGLIGGNICLLIWGGDPVQVSAPPALQGSLRLFGMVFPTYRAFVFAFAAVMALLLYLLIERTKLGAMIRAAVDDRDMARAVGIPVSRLFTVVFCLGSFLVGIAGTMATPVFALYPGLDSSMLLFALIVVIIGGSGSIVGSIVGSLVVGVLYSFGPVYFPDFSYGVLFLPMALILVFMPQGLFGKAEA